MPGYDVMSGYTESLYLAAGALLLTAIAILWRRRLRSVIRAFALQGAALATLAAVLAWHSRDPELAGVAGGLFLLRAAVLPWLLRRALAASGPDADGQREATPLLNVPACLLGAALLVLLAYAVSRPLVALEPGPAGRAIPAGIAVVLIGFFVLVMRRRAVSQLTGLLLMDNGITAVGLLATGGASLMIEAGVSLDVLLAAAVLMILTNRMRETFGDTDLDELRELRD